VRNFNVIKFQIDFNFLTLGLLTLQRSKGLGDPWNNLRNQIMQFSKDQAQRSFNFEMLRMLNSKTTSTTDKMETAPEIPDAVTPPSPPSSKRFKSRAAIPVVENEPRFRRNFEETFLWVDVLIENAS
jgi:hypothetical protein